MSHYDGRRTHNLACGASVSARSKRSRSHARIVFIGLMNYDQRSKHLNTEIGLLITNPELSREVGARFDALTQLDNAYALSLRDTPAGIVWTTQEDGKTLDTRVEPSRSAWRRFRVKLLSLLSFDEEL